MANSRDQGSYSTLTCPIVASEPSLPNIGLPTGGTVVGGGGNIPSFAALSFPRVIHLWESPVAIRRDGVHLKYNLLALVKRSVLSRLLTRFLHNWRCLLFRPFARVLKKTCLLTSYPYRPHKPGKTCLLTSYPYRPHKLETKHG